MDGMGSPLIILVLAYVAGIFLAEYSASPLLISLLFLIIGTIIGVVGYIFQKGRMPVLVWALPIFLSLGAFSMRPLLTPKQLPQDTFRNKESIFEGVIIEAPERRHDGYRLKLKGQGLTVSLSISSDQDCDSQPFRYGDLVRASLRLRIPKNLGNPGGFDYERYLRLNGIDALANLRSFGDIALVGRGGSPFMRWIESMRIRVGQGIERALKGQEMAVMRALILGQQGWISRETEASFRRTGTIHILVVSGFNLTMVAWTFYQALLLFMKRSEFLLIKGMAQKMAACISLVPLALYTSMAGASVPVLRAFVMVCAFIVSFLVGREREIYSTLALSALAILAFEPQALFSISFQLSFLAVISIVYLLPRISSLIGWDINKLFAVEAPWLRKILPWLMTLILTTLAAGLGLSPLLALSFNQVPLFGLAANLIIIPAMGLVCVPLGLLAALSGLVFPPVADVLYTACRPFLLIGLKAVDVIASVPMASIRVTTPTLLEIFLIYLLIVLAVNVKRFRYSKGYIMVILAASLILVADIGYWRIKNLHNKELRVTFLSVGHGDSALVEFPKGKKLLVDGAGTWGDFDLGERVVAPYLGWRKIPRIDYAAWSHAHADHIGGLPFIIENFFPKEIWGPEAEAQSTTLNRLRSSMEKAGSRVFHFSKGNSSIEISGARIEFINPDDSSLVMRIVYGGISFLFAGDIKEQGEEFLLNSGMEISSTVLKLSHHGGKGTSREMFLKRVHPNIAVISTDGRRNFPDLDVIERLKSMGIRILRTDIGGAIIMRTDGKSLMIE